eukprot:tig00000093_g3536.t1
MRRAERREPLRNQRGVAVPSRSFFGSTFIATTSSSRRGCRSIVTAGAGPARARGPVSQFSPLISPSKLEKLLEDEEQDLVVLDVRPLDLFIRGHVPGARHFDMEAEGYDPDSVYPNTLPRAGAFCEAMGRLGVSNSSLVVIVGDPPVNARLWWTLRAFGHTSAAVLDGGYRAWFDEAGTLEAGLDSVFGKEGKFTPRRPPGGAASISAEDLLDELGSVQVLDARDASFFSGEQGKGRGGHVPGARSVPASLFYTADGSFVPEEAAREALRAAGVDLARPAVAYCNRGLQATVLLFALERAAGPAAPHLRLYDPGWEEWGPRKELPVETSAPSLAREGGGAS